MVNARSRQQNMGGKKKWELSAAASKSDNSVESYQHSQATSLKNSLSLSLWSSIKWKFLPNFGDFINVNRGGKIRYEIHKECKVFRLKFSFISVDIVISVYVEMLGLKLAYDNLERQKMRIHQWNFWLSVQILSTVWSMNYSQFTFYSHPPFGLSQKDNRIT